MTVPMMRRSGATMTVATTLANPLTLVIMSPAVLVTILTPASIEAAAIVGSLDLFAAAALLIGGLPIIVFLRRRVPKITEILLAWGYLLLLIAAGVVVAVAWGAPMGARMPAMPRPMAAWQSVWMPIRRERTSRSSHQTAASADRAIATQLTAVAQSGVWAIACAISDPPEWAWSPWWAWSPEHARLPGGPGCPSPPASPCAPTSM